jgi:hypothetical protein
LGSKAPAALGNQPSRISAKPSYDFRKQPKPVLFAIAPPGVFQDFEKLRFKTLNPWNELGDPSKIPPMQGSVKVLFQSHDPLRQILVTVPRSSPACGSRDKYA